MRIMNKNDQTIAPEHGLNQGPYITQNKTRKIKYM